MNQTSPLPAQCLPESTRPSGDMRAEPQSAQGQQRGSFQARVRPWLLECFGEQIAGDRAERNHRFLEEAIELVQSTGCSASEAHQLVDYVFGRPVGEPAQEVGGVMVTLAALCLANGLDMHEAGEVELERISAPGLVLKIRAKQAAKPKHSPLPIALESAPGAPDCTGAKLPWRSVVQALHAVNAEAARRGAMFPQTADEQEEDRKAVRRVAKMVEWYATQGGAVAEKLPDWPDAPMAGDGAPAVAAGAGSLAPL